MPGEEKRVDSNFLKGLLVAIPIGVFMWILIFKTVCWLLVNGYI